MFYMIFESLFIIVPILILCIFAFVIAQLASPKLRGKMMSRQLKATKYMMNEAKDDLTEMGTIVGTINAETKKNILDQNEEILKDVEKRQANIEKEGIRIKTRAIKEGLEQNKIYCKHCGTTIDEDSKFCKHCGKEQ